MQDPPDTETLLALLDTITMRLYRRDWAGHTEGLLNGLRGERRGAVVIAHTMQYAQHLAGEAKFCTARPYPLGHIHKIRGNQYPVYIDHRAIQDLCHEAARTVRQLEAEIRQLKTEIKHHQP